MAKCFPLISVGKMNLDKWNATCQQGVSYCNAAVGIGRGIDNEHIDLFVSACLDEVNQFTFMIALVKGKLLLPEMIFRA